MFERFTDKGRVVLVRTQEIGRELHSPGLRRHHMLLALIDGADENPEDNVTALFDHYGVDRVAFRAAVLESLKATETAAPEIDRKRPFSSGAKKALELSLREALSLGHNYIASSHLLLGILRSADGPLARVIDTTELDHDTAREFVRENLPDGGRRAGRGRGRGLSGRRSRDTEGFDAVLRHANVRAADRPATTGDLLVALAEIPGTHFAAILSGVSLPDPTTIGVEADRLIAANKEDGPTNSISVDNRGRVMIEDEALAQLLRDRIAGEVSQADVVELIRQALRDKK